MVWTKFFNPVMVFWLMLVAITFLNIPFTRVCLKMKTYHGLNSSERSGNPAVLDEYLKYFEYIS
jgi:hypothetical protein